MDFAVEGGILKKAIDIDGFSDLRFAVPPSSNDTNQE